MSRLVRYNYLSTSTQHIVSSLVESRLCSTMASLNIVRLTGSLGARIDGVDLRQPLSEETIAAIHAAFVKHRVIFFRDQHLTPTQQVAFARQFGELTPAHPLVGGLDAQHPEVLVLDSNDYWLGVGDRTTSSSNGKTTSYNNRWHTDVTFAAHPPLASILSAKKIPTYGGDTLWADLIDAYNTLPKPIQTMLDGLYAIHDLKGTFHRFRDEDKAGENRSKLESQEPVRHPVVRIHPDSKERGLFVNPTFTAYIEGFPIDHSRAILDMLYHHSIQPERVVRWSWREGDVAVWDNRSTAHYAAADYHEHRLMYRVTVRGDRPYGPADV
jgi:alpha-ketoglutarate-dependent taurine dioxygenase